MRMLFAGVVILAGCGRIDFTPRQAVDGGPPDACAFGPWSSPRVQMLTNSTNGELSPALSPDGLTVFFQSDRAGGQGQNDLWFATRALVTDDFGPASNAGAVNTGANEIDPTLSSDGLTLYFVSDRGGLNRMFRASRASTSDAFDAGGPVAEVASVEVEGPALSPRGDELFFSQGTGPVNLMHATFDGSQFQNIGPITELDTTTDQGYPSLSGDSLDLYFETTRSDNGHTDLWMASRPTIGAPFEAPSRVDAISISGSSDSDPEIARDGTTLIFDSDRPGSAVLGVASSAGPAPDLWMATRACQ